MSLSRDTDTRDTYTNVIHEAEIDGGWSGQLRIVVGQGQSEQQLVFVDSDLLGPRRLVLTPEEALAVASSLIAADHASGRDQSDADAVRGPLREEDPAPMPTTEYVYDTVRREHRAPDQTDVDIVRGLLDLMAGFADNDQRARYLLSSNWLRDRGAAAAARLQAVSVAEITLLSEAAPSGRARTSGA